MIGGKKVAASGGSVAVEGNVEGSVTTVIGLTFEQHEANVKERLADLETRLG